jgi:predicted PhzF superfamily epimerase YddE/YHI9
MPRLHVLRVFTNEDGEWGNLLGVFLEGGEVPAAARQEVAAELGFSETVFVDDSDSGRIQINTPVLELGFAGHPTVGTAWLLGREGSPVPVLRPPDGEVAVRREDDAVFVAAQPEWGLPWEFVELASPAEVRELDANPAGAVDAFVWAWIDEDAGTIRARCFVPAGGIEEDEATGSAALTLCARLGRAVTIHQGHRSVLRARPLEDGRAEVGGLVSLDEAREHPLPGS